MTEPTAGRQPGGETDVESIGAESVRLEATGGGARETLRLVVIYVLVLIAGSAVFVGLFHTPLFSGVVFFYRGIALLLVATLFTVGLMALLRLLRYGASIQIRDIILVASLLFSGNLVFFTHFPVTADRSISVFMLGYMNETGSELTSQQIAELIVDRYFEDNGAVDKRLDEQLASGNLIRVGDRYRISEQGRRLMASYKTIAVLFGLDTRNVAP